MKRSADKIGKTEKIKVSGAEGKRRSQYFQIIARHFFSWRGAPFFLSSKELGLIAQWEQAAIPLRVVLEGMRRAYEKVRLRKGKGSKILSLSYCDFQVIKAFEQYKERRVGGRRIVTERKEKRNMAKAEVNKFIKTIPPPIYFLKDIYLLAQRVLSKADFKEEELERIEEEIEVLLFKNSSSEEKEKMRKEVIIKYNFRDEQELSSIWRIKLVKHLRDKYKIPYISLFYY